MAALRTCLVVFAVVVAGSFTARAGDPDITVDFIAPAGVIPDGKFFTFTGMREFLNGSEKNVSFHGIKAIQELFPALAGQSVALGVLYFGPSPGGVNSPRIHPRSAELMIVVQGTLNVGFVDSANKLYTQTLYQGDVFLFPKGLVHFQTNPDSKNPAITISAFASENPGTISLPKNIFDSHILNSVLAQSFKTDVDTINKLVSANSG